MLRSRNKQSGNNRVIMLSAIEIFLRYILRVVLYHGITAGITDDNMLRKDYIQIPEKPAEFSGSGNVLIRRQILTGGMIVGYDNIHSTVAKR